MNKIIKVLENLQIKDLDETIIGNAYEEYVATKLIEELHPNFKLIYSDVWKEQYKEYRKSYLSCDYENIHNFENITLASGKQSDNLIIHQPNGSQRSPDLLVIKDKKGFFIEIKTSKTNPAWNSGRLHSAGIYVFKNYKKKDVTFFLKRDVIDNLLDQTINEILEEQKKLSEKYTKLLNKYSTKSFNWKYDTRAIFQDKNDYFGSLKQLRESNVKNFLLSL